MSDVSQSQIDELLRGLARIDKTLRRMDDRMLNHEEKHDALAQAAQEQHLSIVAELNAHALDDAKKFGEIAALVKIRSVMGGVGIALGSAASVLGIRLGGGAQ